jgi:hypothetical protein
MAFPEPEAGLVISYAYLWSNEFRLGKTEGLSLCHHTGGQK